ncbi:MAG: universal stress protein, partial [Flavobacteriales bacterium]
SILVPVMVDPDPQRAIDMAVSTAKALADGRVRFTFLHVGGEYKAPVVTVPEHPNWTTEHMLRLGDPVQTIVDVAEATRADLVVMATKGHDGFLDMLRGSKTERVLRAVRCPIMAVPA